MTVFRHELGQGKNALLIWTGAIGFLLTVCVFLFPEIQGEMNTVGNVFASMGSFTAAFGMDRLNFGTLIGFYAIECGNVVGLGGALYASMLGISALSKEEGSGTAEFLLTHPVSRTRVITEKLAAATVEILAMNGIVLGLSLLSMTAVGEKIPWREVLLMHLAYLLLQLELMGICFGVSAFLRRGGMGIGLGLAIMMYFLNLIANMTDSVKSLKYITPFGYCEGADIVAEGKLDAGMLGVGLLLTAAGIIAADWKYRTKDIF